MRDAKYLLGPCIFRCCFISLNLATRNLCQLRSDFLDLDLEGFHGTLDRFNGRVLFKETSNSFPLSLDIGFPLFDFLMQRLKFVVDWYSSAEEESCV